MLKTVMQTENRKLVGEPGKTRNWSAHPIAVVSRAVGPSCPSSCMFLPEKLGGRGLLPDGSKTGGCYAAQGPTHWQGKKAIPDSGDADALTRFLTKLPASWITRLHVSGDLFINDAPDHDYINALRLAHLKRPDLRTWGYTHGHQQLMAAGYAAADLQVEGLVVNASCDSVEEAKEAHAAGWPVVFVVASDDTRRRWKEGDLDVVTCPNQTVGVACNTCLLCANPSRTFAVAFRAHGSGKKKIDQRFEDLTALPIAGD